VARHLRRRRAAPGHAGRLARASQRGPERDLFESYFGKHFAEVEGCDPLDQATYVDIKTWLADDILVKADRTAMAHSLEVRCPLLDHRIVEFAAQLPPDMKLRGFSKKHLLKRSQRTRLPAWLLDRRKQGFNAPVSQWLLGPLRGPCQDMLFSKPMLEWFDRGQLQRLWDEHERLQRDNGLKLLGLLTVACSSSRRQSRKRRRRIHRVCRREHVTRPAARRPPDAAVPLRPRSRCRDDQHEHDKRLHRHGIARAGAAVGHRLQ
jgi:asparagine synthetase B (glutamine-hydrolysing)